MIEPVEDLYKKEKLLKYGYTSAQIDSLFKKFSEWIKLTCK